MFHFSFPPFFIFFMNLLISISYFSIFYTLSWKRRYSLLYIIRNDPITITQNTILCTFFDCIAHIWYQMILIESTIMDLTASLYCMSLLGGHIDQIWPPKSLTKTICVSIYILIFLDRATFN